MLFLVNVWCEPLLFLMGFMKCCERGRLSLPSAASAEDGGTGHCELRLAGLEAASDHGSVSPFRLFSGTEYFIPIVYMKEKLSCHVIEMISSFPTMYPRVSPRNFDGGADFRHQNTAPNFSFFSEFGHLFFRNIEKCKNLIRVGNN